MEKVMKEVSFRDKSMDKVSILGKMETDILEIFSMIKDKDSVNISGKMEGFIKDNGVQIA
jgi:hypothetical protein